MLDVCIHNALHVLHVTSHQEGSMHRAMLQQQWGSTCGRLHLMPSTEQAWLTCLFQIPWHHLQALCVSSCLQAVFYIHMQGSICS